MTIPTTISLASKLHQLRWSSAESFGQCISSPKTSGERLSLVAVFTAHVSKDTLSPWAEVILAGSTTLSCIQLHFTAVYPRHRSKNIWSFHTEMPRKHKRNPFFYVTVRLLQWDWANVNQWKKCYSSKELRGNFHCKAVRVSIWSSQK